MSARRSDCSGRAKAVSLPPKEGSWRLPQSARLGDFRVKYGAAWRTRCRRPEPGTPRRAGRSKRSREVSGSAALAPERRHFHRRLRARTSGVQTRI